MAVSRREFFKRTGPVMAGTAIGALGTLGANLAPKVVMVPQGIFH